MPEAPGVPLCQVGELCQTAGGDVGGGPAGLVEVYHPLRLVKGAEELGAPLGLVVGGLVADFDSHRLGCLVWDNSTGSGGSGGRWWTVRKVAQQRQQGASGAL